MNFFTIRAAEIRSATRRLKLRRFGKLATASILSAVSIFDHGSGTLVDNQFTTLVYV